MAFEVCPMRRNFSRNFSFTFSGTTPNSNVGSHFQFSRTLLFRVFMRVKNVGKAKPETNLKKQSYMKEYVIILAVGGAIHFAGCGGPSEDSDAIGEGEPATKMSDKDRKAAEKMGIEFDPNTDQKE